jgi:hypothetical protein
MKTTGMRMVVVAVSAIALGGCTKLVHVPPEEANLIHCQKVESIDIPNCHSRARVEIRPGVLSRLFDWIVFRSETAADWV